MERSELLRRKTNPLDTARPSQSGLPSTSVVILPELYPARAAPNTRPKEPAQTEELTKSGPVPLIGEDSKASESSSVDATATNSKGTLSSSKSFTTPDAKRVQQLQQFDLCKHHRKAAELSHIHAIDQARQLHKTAKKEIALMPFSPKSAPSTASPEPLRPWSSSKRGPRCS
ncbi:hypothetical protein AAVH_41921 [Aphelenchoides avenae]|nr:hypothetical protein AAVH_41921 [Aphelenchus avenae]